MVPPYSFVHHLYESWLEASADIRALFFAPRLASTAWHWVTERSLRQRQRMEHFVSEFRFFQAKFDTKERNFFFR